MPKQPRQQRKWLVIAAAVLLTATPSFALLRRLRIAKPIRYVLAVLLIGLILVVLIYTMSLFLTLEERISATHVATVKVITHACGIAAC